MACFKLWVDILSTLLIPTIAIAGYLLARSNRNLARQKREDDLFGMRYELYRKIFALWVCAGGSDVDFWEQIIPRLSAQEINSLPDQSGFLFDKEIQDFAFSMVIGLQILGYPGFEHLKGSGSLKETTDFPRKLFDKYLKLK